MRMRHKPYARPELAAWEHCIDQPRDCRGRWNTVFSDPKLPLWLELGCGKGGFAALLAAENAGKINLLAIDIKSEMLVVAKRNIERVYAEKGLPIGNVKIMSHQIELIGQILSESDRVERLYINFCNPWNRDKQKKKRLTHTKQLRNYLGFLTENALLYFKTDDDMLFAETLPYLSECGFSIDFLTTDLAANRRVASGVFGRNIETEHEQMFSREGKKIKFLIARAGGRS